jgi:putative membrane protein
MRLKVLVTTIATAALSVAGAGAQSTPADRQPAGSAQTASAASREFVNDMAVAGLAEVQLGKMASEHASSPDIKAFGQMMVKDHSRANTELTRIATQLGITPPKQLDAKHKELADKLSKLKGAEFDREYMNAMVEGHQEVANKLKSRAAEKTGGAVGTSGKGEQALTQWATKTLPAVEKHLERAKELQGKVK